MNMTNNNMKKYNFSGMFYVAMFFLFIAVVFIWFAIIRISIIAVIDGETGELHSNHDKLKFLIPASIVGLTWTVSFIVLCYQRFIVKAPVTIDDNGVYNTNIGGIFLAFIFIAPVRFIPWDKLYLDGLSLKVKKDYHNELPLVQKLLIKVFGIKLFVGYSKLDDLFYRNLITDEISNNFMNLDISVLSKNKINDAEMRNIHEMLKLSFPHIVIESYRFDYEVNTFYELNYFLRNVFISLETAYNLFDRIISVFEEIYKQNPHMNFDVIAENDDNGTSVDKYQKNCNDFEIAGLFITKGDVEISKLYYQSELIKVQLNFDYTSFHVFWDSPNTF
ncbi:hypothetical protein KHQ81_02235 [Mycoplasmatota bacterium]|nr:hypothetical protein KHQ81_02235 [Mycoplasmatota bacterium]